MTAPIRDMAGLVEAIRRRKDELNISNETIDAIAGFQSGYAGKVLAPKPIRHVGYMSLGLILGALGVGLQVVEDEEIRVKVEGRWQVRKRSVPPAASMNTAKRDEKLQKADQNGDFARMQMLGKMGGIMSGKKRRARAMRRREIQRKRAHAARMRWAKERSA